MSLQGQIIGFFFLYGLDVSQEEFRNQITIMEINISMRAALPSSVVQGCSWLLVLLLLLVG